MSAIAFPPNQIKTSLDIRVGARDRKIDRFAQPLSISRAPLLDTMRSTFSVMDKGTQALVTKMIGLLDETEDYDEDFLKPTRHAVFSAWWMLLRASQYLTSPSPEGDVYPDGDGGLRIEWNMPDRLARLIIPENARGKTYLYYHSSTEDNANFTVTPQVLAQRLDWLNG